MLLEETLPIKAPKRKVWDTLLDIPFLVSCIPGIEQVAEVDANTYHMVLKAKVSFITAAFDMTVTIVDRQEPDYLNAKGEGKGHKGAGRVTFHQTINLKSLSENETEVAYKLEFNLVGKLATVGGKVIARKASEIANEFRQAFTAKCEELI